MTTGIGERLGHYRILGPLGAGGMGEVHAALDTRLGRRVALKVLPAEAAADPERLARFAREAQALAALNHPGIVTVYSVEQSDDVHFYTMELVEGVTLRERIPTGGMAQGDLLTIAVPLVAAVHAAHEHGITHRDLKPANVMIAADGRVKVLDFGLARLEPAIDDLGAATTAAELTRDGQLLGTVPYMAPEQVEGRPADHRADLFALGVILYEMAVGDRPFAGGSMAAVAAAILRETPPAPSSRNAAVPAQLDRLIRRCLEKRPEQRPQTAAEVLAELEAIRGETVGTASPAAGRPGIAVLPFVNMSADPEQEYFCDGLAEEIITALSRISGLRVAARTSAFAFKGRDADVREIGRQLGVGAVLEGSVRRSGDRLRVTAQLIEAAGGFHLWSERFDRRLDDVFAIQDEIALAIVDRLKVTLGAGERSRVVRRSTESREALQAYLKGRFFFHRRRSGDFERAIAEFEEAIARDPGFAAPHVALAGAFAGLGLWGFLPPGQALARAEPAVRRALELDPEFAEAHLQLGFLRLLFVDGGAEAAERHFLRAFELGVDDALGHAWYAMHLAHTGQPEVARVEALRACELDPLNPMTRTAAAAVLIMLGDVDGAAGLLERALELDPDQPVAHLWLGVCASARGRHAEAITLLRRAQETGLPTVLPMVAAAEARAGRVAEARATLAQAEAVAAQRYLPAGFLASAHAALGDLDRAEALLRQGLDAHEPTLILGHPMAIYPELHAPRFAPLWQAAARRRGGATDHG